MNLEFTVVFLCLGVSACLAGFISMVSYSLGQKSPDKEKVSVYECGFDPFHNPGEPFSIRFFLVAILFLVFDLEMSYLFPWSVTTFFINEWGQSIVALFILVLIGGLVYEWVKGGLEWE